MTERWLTRRAWLAAAGTAALPATATRTSAQEAPDLVATANGGYGRLLGPLVVSGRQVTVRDADWGSLTFGGRGRSLAFRTLPAGEELVFHPDPGAEPVTVDRVFVDGHRSFGDAGLPGYGEEAGGFATIPGRWEGPEFFHRPGFETVEAELRDQDGAVVSGTGPVTVATAYPWVVETVDETARITRLEGVDPDWHVRFSIEDPTDDGRDRRFWSLDSQPGADRFAVDLSHLDLPEGSYNWDLEIRPSAGADVERTIVRLSPVSGTGRIHVGQAPGVGRSDVAAVGGLGAAALVGGHLYRRFRGGSAPDPDPEVYR